MAKGMTLQETRKMALGVLADAKNERKEQSAKDTLAWVDLVEAEALGRACIDAGITKAEGIAKLIGLCETIAFVDEDPDDIEARAHELKVIREAMENTLRKCGVDRENYTPDEGYATLKRSVEGALRFVRHDPD